MIAANGERANDLCFLLGSVKASTAPMWPNAGPALRIGLCWPGRSIEGSWLVVVAPVACVKITSHDPWKSQGGSRPEATLGGVGGSRVLQISWEPWKLPSYPPQNER